MTRIMEANVQAALDSRATCRNRSMGELAGVGPKMGTSVILQLQRWAMCKLVGSR